MASYKFFDTTLPANYSKTLVEEFNADLAPEYTDKVMDTVISATVTVLNVIKSKKKPAAFKFARPDKSFVAAGIVQFFENSDKKNPGNWNLVFTFNEDDIPDDATVVDLTDPTYHAYFVSIAGEKHRFNFATPTHLINLAVQTYDQIHKWLDENAKEGEEMSIELPGTFQARVAVEGGEKVFALEPDGEVKQLIKDDAAIEK